MFDRWKIIQTLRAFRRTIPVVLCISVKVCKYVLLGVALICVLSTQLDFGGSCLTKASFFAR